MPARRSPSLFADAASHSSDVLRILLWIFFWKPSTWLLGGALSEFFTA